MAEDIKIGDRVQVYLDSKFWERVGWFEGTVTRIDPYSVHRSFYWVELDDDVQTLPGQRMKLISVLNPKNIKKT